MKSFFIKNEFVQKRCKVTTFNWQCQYFALSLHSNNNFLNKKDVKLSFQKSIATSQATLPVVVAVGFVLWFVLPTVNSQLSTDYGLWHHVPPSLQSGYWALGIGAACAALAVYLTAELNNANVLLRVNSRMLSSMLAILLCLATVCHPFQPGSVVMVLFLMSLFPLFASYQQPNPFLTLLTYLLVSVASLVFPRLLWLVPVYWLIQGYLRSFSLRCCIASLLAVMLPYWLYGGIAVLTDTLADFLTHLQAVITFQVFDYTHCDLRTLILYSFILLLLVTGIIDFYLHQFLDKTRTRIIYNSLIIYGIIFALWIALQPQYFTTLFPLLLIPTSILFGHFFTLTHTRFTHIYCLLLMVLAVAVLVVQLLPPDSLYFNL
jgi:hypothetical protein